MKKLAFYGGSFDPVHLGHLTIARELINQFHMDEFVLIPAFHAPHKLRKKPTSAYDRYAMLCLATQNEPDIEVSKIEIEMPDRPYSIETLSRLNAMHPRDEIYFVMGADSWMDITTWRDWEKVLSLTNHIVVTRPGISISFAHVTDAIRANIVDLRGSFGLKSQHPEGERINRQIFFTDAVELDISASE